MSTIRLLLSLSAVLACACTHAADRATADRTLPASGRPETLQTSGTKAGHTQASMAGRQSHEKRELRQGGPSLPPQPHRLADIDPPHGASLVNVGWNGRRWPPLLELPAPSPSPPTAGTQHGGHPTFSIVSSDDSVSRQAAPRLSSHDDTTVVPEPSTCLLLALGLAIVWLKRRRSEWSRWHSHPG